MYKRITSLATILLLAACSADSQPETVAVNAGEAAVPIDVGHLTRSKGQSGQPAAVSLPHVKTARVETTAALSADEPRVQLPELFGPRRFNEQQPVSVASELTEARDESVATSQPVAVDPAGANAANTDVSVAGPAADQSLDLSLDLSLDYRSELNNWSSDEWFAYVPGDTSAKGVKDFDAGRLFKSQAGGQNGELSFSFVPTLKPDQELAWTRIPELDGGSVSFEVKTR